jgi:hypothetical protein
MRQYRQNIVERGTRGFQNHLDTFDGVPSLLANVSADLPGNWVAAGLTGHEHQIAKTCGWGEIRIPRSKIHLNNFFLSHLVSFDRNVSKLEDLRPAMSCML